MTYFSKANSLLIVMSSLCWAAPASAQPQSPRSFVEDQAQVLADCEAKAKTMQLEDEDIEVFIDECIYVNTDETIEYPEDASLELNAESEEPLDEFLDEAPIDEDMDDNATEGFLNDEPEVEGSLDPSTE